MLCIVPCWIGQEGALPWQEDCAVSHADGTEGGGDHLQIGIGGLVDKPPSQGRQPSDSNNNGGGQEGHCRPLRSVIRQNSNNNCGDASLPEQRSALRAIHTLNTPQNYTRLLGELSPIHSVRRYRAQGLMWGARVPFPLVGRRPWLWRVVTPVVICAEATKNF